MCKLFQLNLPACTDFFIEESLINLQLTPRFHGAQCETIGMGLSGYSKHTCKFACIKHCFPPELHFVIEKVIQKTIYTNLE